jgi:hypothetical protein
MSRDWMIDVLVDLRSFAGANTMPNLAEAIDDAILIAAAELRVEGVSADVSSAGNYAAGSAGRTYQDSGYP